MTDTRTDITRTDIRIEGRARLVGDDVNTDAIIRSQRKRESIDPEVLKEWLLETLSPDFASSVRQGDVLVAGKNFGCGSAMEVAVTVLQAAGIRAVLAESFSRTYFRNAINNGLIPVECDTRRIEEGDHIEIRLRPGQIQAHCPAVEEPLQGRPLSGVMLEILEAGGLTTFIRDRGCFSEDEHSTRRDH